MQPIYRSDIKGQVAEIVAECEASMRGEMATADEFILAADDTDAWHEYANFLTPAEMQRAFKRARSAPAAADACEVGL